ncbi:MAG: hypothetical protein ACOYOE_13370 [Chlorobium sp.]
MLDGMTDVQRNEAIVSNELKEIESLYLESLELTTKDGYDGNAAIVHQQLGLLYFMRGEFDRSLLFYQNSYSIVNNQPNMRLTDLNSLSTCQMFFALIALEKGNYSLARAEILKAIDIDKSLNNPWFLQMDKRILARCKDGHDS